MWDPWIGAKISDALEREERALAIMDRRTIKKYKGAISLQNGEILDCDIEIDMEPTPIDEEAMEQTQDLNESIRKAQQQQIYLPGEPPRDEVILHKIVPVVDSTLAEKGPEDV